MVEDNNKISKDAPFVFIVDDGETYASGLVAYGSPIRTSLGSSDVGSKVASCVSSKMRWMAIYPEDGNELEQHALLWHTACFAF